MPGVIRVYCIFNHGRAPNDSMGAHIAGGRWNPPGYPVLYTSSHLSLACLEKLIHLRLRYAWADLPGDLTSLNVHGTAIGNQDPYNRRREE